MRTQNHRPEHEQSELPSHEEQADFFARLENALEESGIEPEPAWKARTIGHLELNPESYRTVIASCALTILLAFGWIGYAWQVSHRQPDTLRLPPGYTLLRSPQGEVIAFTDRSETPGTQDRLREDALAELQRLLSESQEPLPADAIQVSSSSQ